MLQPKIVAGWEQQRRWRIGRQWKDEETFWHVQLCVSVLLVFLIRSGSEILAAASACSLFIILL